MILTLTLTLSIAISIWLLTNILIIPCWLRCLLLWLLLILLLFPSLCICLFIPDNTWMHHLLIFFISPVLITIFLHLLCITLLLHQNIPFRLLCLPLDLLRYLRLIYLGTVLFKGISWFINASVPSFMLRKLIKLFPVISELLILLFGGARIIILHQFSLLLTIVCLALSFICLVICGIYPFCVITSFLVLWGWFLLSLFGPLILQLLPNLLINVEILPYTFLILLLLNLDGNLLLLGWSLLWFGWIGNFLINILRLIYAHFD